MREILFRAKRKDNGEWIEGNIVNSEGVDKEYNAIIIPKKNSEMFTSGEPQAPDLGFEEWIMVDPKTVCQYTGLTDKDGLQKIFDGDIVKVPLFKPDVMAIGFIEGAFCLVNSKQEYVTDIHYIHHAGVNQTEIIGNIFDNPELIGE